MSETQPIPAVREDRPLVAALRPAIWILVVFGILRIQADPDLWGHLKMGLDLLEHGTLSTTDPYSFTQDIPFTNHEWLGGLVMALAYRIAGTLGLAVLKAMLVGATFYLVAGAVREAAPVVRRLTLALAVWGALSITGTLRPQLWTLLFLAVLCRALVAWDTRGTSRSFFALPVIFVLWANLHGGWILGLGVLGVWSVFTLIEQRGSAPSSTRLVAVVLLSALATLVNPYGWQLWAFIASTVRLSRADITEWQPIWRDEWGGVLQWGMAMFFVLFVLWRWRRPRLGAIAVTAMLAYASLRVNRLVPMFMETAVVLLAPYFPRAQAVSGTTLGARTLVDVCATVAAVVIAAQTSLLPRCIAIAGTWIPDMTAASAMKSAGAKGRLVTWFDWGEYAIWHLSPGLKVSIDARRETLYSERTLEEQRAIGFGEPAGLAALERLAPEYVWLPREHSARTAAWLRENRYRIDVQTDRSFVAVREDLPTITLPSFEPTRCFPGP
jgi:hypothetical protein